MDSDKALTLLLELAVHNLCTIRKLADVVITLQNLGNAEQGIASMRALRIETAKSTQDVLQKIWAKDGQINIDDILGKDWNV